MKYMKRMELLLIGVVIFLCGILCFNLFRKLWSVLPWRVNCWFCNTNSWVKYPQRNCWTCPRCEQYNGFTKDGDYNKPLLNTSDQLSKTQKIFKSSPPKNGLCKMCNINQQLKVTQLANYVPMNERNFDDEIESYRLQLERAYKLCSPCKKNVQMKLHKEKEALLGTKVMQSRSPEKKKAKEPKQNEKMRKILNQMTKLISWTLLILLLVETYTAIMQDKILSKTIRNIKDIVFSLVERAFSILLLKMDLTFPFRETYEDFTNKTQMELINLKTKYHINLEFDQFDKLNEAAQGSLGGLACLLQIFGHFLNIYNLKYNFALDILWTAFVVACLAQPYATASAITICFIKISCIALVLIVLKNLTVSAKTTGVVKNTPPKRIKHLSKLSKSAIEDSSSMDTDDDVSLTKFGLHNYTDSSNENATLMNSFNSGRAFSPRNRDSAWSRPAMNSTFHNASFTSHASKSPSSVSETIFAKPAFDKYQNMARDDSDSDLDESISGLCIGSPRDSKKRVNSMFSLRKFTATPNFVTPTVAPVLRRQLISPGKLGHGASWVAGGYWGSEGERQPFSVDGSRSSSQSSGFESQASSANQRLMASQPPSREASLCGEAGWGTTPTPAPAPRVFSPVFPPLRRDAHVQLPRPAPPPPSGVFAYSQQQYVQSSLFKAPGGSGLYNLPQANSFLSH